MTDDIFDLHIEVLKLMNLEMQRLHQKINGDNGDHIDVYHAQLNNLNEELCRLSEVLSEKECK